MAVKRASILVSGNVQTAGFRTFIKNLADSLGITGYAENLPDGRVNIVCEGEEENIAELVSTVKTEPSALSKVEGLQIKYGKYIGEFLDFERRGKDVPKKATLDDLLNVMISFDNKAEKIVGVLGEMKNDLSEVKSYTSQIPAIKDNTEKMLEKQDITIDILKSVKGDTAQIRQDTAQIRQDTAQIRQDTSQIPGIVENTSKILEHTSHIPAMKEDTAAIRYDTREIAAKLWDKYEELSKEIAQMKITLSKIEAKVFS